MEVRRHVQESIEPQCVGAGGGGCPTHPSFVDRDRRLKYVAYLIMHALVQPGILQWGDRMHVQEYNPNWEGGLAPPTPHLSYHGRRQIYVE